MGKRTITGAVYVALITAFFFLREYVAVWTFDILIALFCAFSTFEVARAVKPWLIKNLFYLAVAFGIVIVPIYSLFQYLGIGYGYVFVLADSLILSLVIAIICVVKQKPFKEKLANILPFVYPVLLLLTMLLCNGYKGEKGLISLLLIFVIPALSDTFAYLVGMTFNKIKKGKAKRMCPKLSPKKTWAGAVGGIVGGVVGSLLIKWVFNPKLLLTLPYLFFIGVGVIGAIFTEIGDLSESLIKRKVNIKDMGKILPGHGGVMDRIDGMSLASAFIFFAFLFI